MVDSGNFTLGADGVLSATGAYIDGVIYSNGLPTLTSRDIYVGSSEPQNKRLGMVWIQPGAEESTPTSSNTTHTYSMSRGSRLGLSSNPLSGSLSGSAASAAGNTYQYELEVPVYLGGTVNGASVTVTLSNGAGSVTMTGTVSGNNYDHRVLTMTTTAGVWLAAYGTINFTLSSSTNAVLNEKSDSGKQLILRSYSRS